MEEAGRGDLQVGLHISFRLPATKETRSMAYLRDKAKMDLEFIIKDLDLWCCAQEGNNGLHTRGSDSGMEIWMA